ncbi:MAG TPA: Flp pilus assembly complex ATPase component TadA [Candidatus Anaerobutyricum avicola]|nr:Flp pilus assembly complex ATPase component TadA [Candidatus Anaerobutyricum avicola]
MEVFSKQELRREVLERLNGYGRPSDEEIYREIDRVILSDGHSRYGTLQEKRMLREQLFYSIRGFDVLEEYLQDDTVTEIMVIGASKIFVEQNGVLKKTDKTFFSEEEVYRLIDQMIAPLNRMVNESVPIVDGRLPDGSRVHVVLPPVSLEGPVITIRKFQKGGMTMERLMESGEFPPELAAVLACLVRGRYSILLSGATNSGKSSLLNALAEYLLPDERIITIEDSAELQLYHVDNLVRMETRNSNTEGVNEISMNDLIKASLRMRPTRIIVGEVRGEEAAALLNAASTGHSGSLSTIHGNSCRDALRRLETMVLMGMDIPLRAVQGLIASAVDILIHLGRLSTGQRKILEIYELLDFDGQDYQMNALFLYDREEEGREGRLMAAGRLSRTERLKDYGQMQAYLQAMEVFDEKYGT